jgi:hypothetical protein
MMVMMMMDDDREVTRKLRVVALPIFLGEGHDISDRARIIDRSEFMGVLVTTATTTLSHYLLFPTN